MHWVTSSESLLCIAVLMFLATSCVAIVGGCWWLWSLVVVGGCGLWWPWLLVAVAVVVSVAVFLVVAVMFVGVT